MRHAWSTRLVLITGGVLFAVSSMCAAVRSEVTPWTAIAAAAVPTRPAVPSGQAMRPMVVLFNDDFADDPVGTIAPRGWTVVDGRWDGVVEDDDHMLRHGAGWSYGHMVTGSPSWTDYDVSADVRSTSSPDGFSAVVARYRGPGDYYACGLYHAGTLRLWLMRRGELVPLASQPIAVDTRQMHNVRLGVSGASLECAYDGKTMATASDRTIESGRIGLVGSDGEPAEFTHVMVMG